MRGVLTIHRFLVDIINSVIPVDNELILLLGISNLSDLIFVVDEIAKDLNVRRNYRILRKSMRESSKHFSRSSQDVYGLGEFGLKPGKAICLCMKPK